MRRAASEKTQKFGKQPLERARAFLSERARARASWRPTSLSSARFPAGDDGGAAAAVRAEQEKKRKQYESRGIMLMESVDLAALTEPYLVNIDEDEFRTKRFLSLPSAFSGRVPKGSCSSFS